MHERCIQILVDADLLLVCFPRVCEERLDRRCVQESLQEPVIIKCKAETWSHEVFISDEAGCEAGALRDVFSRPSGISHGVRHDSRTERVTNDRHFDALTVDLDDLLNNGRNVLS